MSSPREGPRGGLRAFFLSSFASFLGHSMFGYAAIIYTQARTGSQLLSGIVFLCMNAPLILIGYYAGTVADRTARKVVLLVSNTVCALTVLAVGAFELFSPAGNFLPYMSVLASCYGVAFAFVPGARFAMVGELTRSGDIERSTVSLTVLNMLGFGLGPLIVGWTLGLGGWFAMFGCLSAVWLLSVVALVPVQGRSARPTPNTRSTHRDLRAGVSFVLSQPAVWQLCALMLLIVVLTFGPYQVLVPAFGLETLGLSESGRGALMATFGAGLVVGGITSRSLTERSRRGRWIVGAATAACVSVSLLPAAPGILTAGVLLAGAGIFSGIAASLIPATMQSVTPDAFRGRVMSLHAIILGGFPALGGMLAGALAEVFGVPAALHLSGALGVAAVALMALTFPALRDLRGTGIAAGAHSAGVAVRSREQ